MLSTLTAYIYGYCQSVWTDGMLSGEQTEAYLLDKLKKPQKQPPATSPVFQHP